MASVAAAQTALQPTERRLSDIPESGKTKSIVPPSSNGSHQGGRVDETTFAEAMHVVSEMHQIRSESETTLSLDAVLMEHHEAADTVQIDGSSHASSEYGESDVALLDERNCAKGGDAIDTDAALSGGVFASACKEALAASSVLAQRAPWWLALELWTFFILMLPLLTILANRDSTEMDCADAGSSGSTHCYTTGDLALRPFYVLLAARIASHGLKLSYSMQLYRTLPATVSHLLQCFLGWPTSVLLWIPGMIACIIYVELDSEPW
jgi:hypothetical protein